MPYPMIHMCIAKKVAELCPNKITNLPQYYLGSLSPDAIHFRDNFIPNDKNITHLYNGTERWGEISNNDEWTNYILTFLQKHKGSENIDFIYGYCVHVLTDMRNNIDFWIPLKMKLYCSNKIPDENVYDSKVRKDLRIDEIFTDNYLYKTVFQYEIQQFLSEATGTMIEGIVTEDEVSKIRDNILYHQYKDMTLDSSYIEKYISLEDYLKFIDKTAKIISTLVFS